MKHEGWAELGIPPGSERSDVLDAYLRLLIDRAVPLGMIAASDEARVRDRHLIDCLRASSLFLPADSSAIDLGSGAGLPGIPLAVTHPEVHFTLVESRKRRAAFLELTVEKLGLGNITVFPGRVEELTERADLCLARAFAALARCWLMAADHLLPGGRLIYWAGGSFDVASVQGVLPKGVAIVVTDTLKLERFGPLVMMTRQ